MQKIVKEGKYTAKIMNKQQYGDKYLVVLKGLDKEILISGNKEVIENKIIELIRLLTEVYIQLNQHFTNL
jgi:hypothetical protein